MGRVIVSVVAFIICTFLGLCLKGEMTFFNVMWAVLFVEDSVLLLYSICLRVKMKAKKGKMNNSLY